MKQRWFEGIETTEGLKAFVEALVRRQAAHEAHRKADEEQTKALYAAYSLFEQYCEEKQLADAYREAPEDWTEAPGGTLTIEEVRRMGDELDAGCDDLLEVARKLWCVAINGYD